MSRLNTMYPDDEFLKNISDMMGKLDNKNETEIKQEIEQIGYKEFYRYYKEKDVYIKQLKEILEKMGLEPNEILYLQQENKQLKDNWNKLKEFIKSQNDGGIFSDLMIISDVLNKMQELEKSDSNE